MDLRLNPVWAVGVRMEYTPYHTIQPKRTILFVDLEELHDSDSIKQDRSIIGEYKTTAPIYYFRQARTRARRLASCQLNIEQGVHRVTDPQNVSKSSPTYVLLFLYRQCEVR